MSIILKKTYVKKHSMSTNHLILLISRQIVKYLCDALCSQSNTLNASLLKIFHRGNENQSYLQLSECKEQLPLKKKYFEAILQLPLYLPPLTQMRLAKRKKNYVYIRVSSCVRGSLPNPNIFRLFCSLVFILFQRLISA